MFTENSNETPAHLYRGRRYGKPFLRVFFEELQLDESGSAQFAAYEHQDYALVEIVDHQRRYSKVEK